jgi:hypothetical protein
MSDIETGAGPAGPPGVSRRGFLRGMTGGTAAIAAASLLPAGCAPDYAERRGDGAALAALTPKEYAVARAAADAMLVGVGAEPDQIAARIDAELAVAGEPMRSDMKTVLSLMEHGTLLSFRRRRFSALSPEARREVLQDWATSRFKLRRAAFQALKGFVVFYAYIDDNTRPLTGFQGPWPERIHVPAYDVDFGEIA